MFLSYCYQIINFLHSPQDDVYTVCVINQPMFQYKYVLDIWLLV